MGLTKRLAEAAGITTRRVGSLELIASKDVAAFLRVAEDRGVVILGIESFRSHEGHIVPDIDAIADFSGLPRDPDLPAATVEEARRFLLQVLHPEMFFEFAIEEIGAKR